MNATKCEWCERSLDELRDPNVQELCVDCVDAGTRRPSRETEAQDWLRVRVALSTYMKNQLPDGLRFEDGDDFKQCVMDVIDDLEQEVSA